MSKERRASGCGETSPLHDQIRIVRYPRGKRLIKPAIVFFMLVTAGCGQEDAGSNARQILRQQQLRANQKAAATQTTQQRLETAQRFFDDQNFVEAGNELSRILIADPEDMNALLLSARVEAAQGNEVSAIRILDSMENADPELELDKLWLAVEWSTQSGDYATAENRLRQLLQVSNDLATVHRQLAIILNNQGRRIEAAPHLLSLAKLGKITEKELFAMTTYGNPFIDTTLPKPKRGDVLNAAMLAQAKVSRSDGDMNQAVALTAQLRESFPDSTPIAAFQGRLYTELQNEEALRSWFTSLPAGMEREPEYWTTTGIWMQRHDRHREAVRCLCEAVLRDPTDRYAYQALERSLRFSGENEKADTAADRETKLSEAARLARKFGLKRGSRLEMNQMADILLTLGRPWESVAWRETAARYYATTEKEKSELMGIRQQLEKDDSSATDQFLTCNVDRKSWPLPTVADFTSRSEINAPPVSAAEHVQIRLSDDATNVGLEFTYDNGDRNRNDDAVFIYQLTGGGIGIIDYNLDGWMDIYFTQGGGAAFDQEGSKPNQLFANLQGERFQQVVTPSGTGDRGYGQGVAVADLNQDGFPDLVVANLGPNVVYINNGDGTFSSTLIPSENQSGEWTTSIACGDLGGDHLPEIVEINYIDDATALTTPCTPNSSHCSPRAFQPAADRVWQLGEAGQLSPFDGCQEITSKPSFGFAAVLTDFDGKPGNELFIANDTRANHFWTGMADETSGRRQLRENAKLFGCGSDSVGRPRGCMGIAHGDLDHNGTLDLQVTNYWNEPSDIYLQRKTGMFVPANLDFGTFTASQNTVGWGTQAGDCARKAWLDLAVLNGHVVDKPGSEEPYEMKPQLFQALSDGSSTRVSVTPQSRYWQESQLGRTMAVIDWNRDSRPDLVTNHLDGPVALLTNNTVGGQSIEIELIGTESERDATGTQLTITCGQQTWTRWQAGGDGFLCSNESVLDFGLGDVNSIDRVDVRWPSGNTQTFADLQLNRRYLIIEGESVAYPRD